MPKRRKLSFKKGTSAYDKRRQIAEAMLREDPGMDEDKKFAIATDATKKHFRRKKPTRY